MMTRTLIINADDFGLDESVNAGIARAAREGVLTSATLLTTCAAAEPAVALAADLPQLGVGTHLDLTEGRPITDPARVPLLVDSAGRFLRSPWRLIASSLSRRFLDQARIEWAAQIDWLIARGCPPTHVDSHKHVCLMPALFAIACELARERGIGWMRVVREPAWNAPWSPVGETLSRSRFVRQWSMARLAAWTAGAVNSHQARRAGLRCPDQCLGVANTGGWSARSLHALIDRLPPGASELFVHPGMDPGESPGLRAGRLARSRPAELALLVAPQVREHIERAGIQLRHFGTIGA